MCVKGEAVASSFFLRDFLRLLSYLGIMHIIPTTGTAEVIFLPFVAQGAGAVSAIVTDENTNESVTASGFSLGPWSVDSNYLQWVMDWAIGMGNLTRKEGNYYSFKFENTDGSLLYKGQIYVTQTPTADLPKYTLNANAYIEQAGNNEFIVL